MNLFSLHTYLLSAPPTATSATRRCVYFYSHALEVKGVMPEDLKEFHGPSFSGRRLLGSGRNNSKIVSEEGGGGVGVLARHPCWSAIRTGLFRFLACCFGLFQIERKSCVVRCLFVSIFICRPHNKRPRVDGLSSLFRTSHSCVRGGDAVTQGSHLPVHASALFRRCPPRFPFCCHHAGLSCCRDIRI